MGALSRLGAQVREQNWTAEPPPGRDGLGQPRPAQTPPLSPCCPCRVALQAFMEQGESTRLLFYADGKDLVAVRRRRRGRLAQAACRPHAACCSCRIVVPSCVPAETCKHSTRPCPLVLQTTSSPGKLRRKTVYFLKLARAPLVKEDLDKLVGAAAGPGGC
jgi:hypothetical protein